MPEWLRQRASISPRRLALICGGERWTFEELDRRVSAVTSRLSPLVQPEQRIALLARNGLDFVLAAHAVPRLGCVLVPLNVHLTDREALSQITDCEPSLLLYDEPNAAKVRELSAGGLNVRCVPLSELTADTGEASSQGRETVDLSAVHTIIYTSGTSGTAKGAMLTFGNHWWSAMGSALNLGLRHDDRWLACLPLFHVGGLATLLRGVICGTTVIVHAGFDAAAVNRAIEEEGVTIVSLVPTTLARLLAERGSRPFPPSLRCLLVGGGPLPASLLGECAALGWPVAPTYGLTEAASQVATLPPGEAGPPGSSGRPLFPTEIRIESEPGKAAPPETPGEVLVRGPAVTPGYFRRPEETKAALRGGWLRTGDIGCLDGEGLLHVLDRRDDLIVSGGENVYPAEVEEVLRSHPDVLDAGVTGLPDGEWGQRVAAAVVLRAGARAGEESLMAFCRERLARYKAPRELRLVTELPRNPGGKVLRRALREEW